MKCALVIFTVFFFPISAFAACPAAPVGAATDSVAQMKQVGGRAGFGPSSAMANNEEGAVVYDSTKKTLVVCDGTNWKEMGGGGSGGSPTGAVMAFDLSTCPLGWSEYTLARGRFIRGIDPSGTNDPDGLRAAGSLQGDAIKALPLPWLWRGGEHSGGFADGSSYAGLGSTQNKPAGWPTGTETRPKNVALLYCRKD